MTNPEEEIKKTQIALDGVWDDIATKMAEVCPDMTAEIAAIRAKAEQTKADREALVKKCHPDDKHWPPNVECPVCQKLLGRVEKMAKDRCANPDDEKELTQKFGEVFHELYAKKETQQ